MDHRGPGSGGEEMTTSGTSIMCWIKILLTGVDLCPNNKLSFSIENWSETRIRKILRSSEAFSELKRFRTSLKMTCFAVLFGIFIVYIGYRNLNMTD